MNNSYRVWYISKRDGREKEGLIRTGSEVRGARYTKIEHLKLNALPEESEWWFKTLRPCLTKDGEVVK